METNYAKMIGLDNTKWQDLFLPSERGTENNQQEGLQGKKRNSVLKMQKKSKSQ